MYLIIKIIIIVSSVTILSTIIYFSIKNDKSSAEDETTISKSEYPLNETTKSGKDESKKGNKIENAKNIHEIEKLPDSAESKNKQDNIPSSKNLNANDFYKSVPETTLSNEQKNSCNLKSPVMKIAIEKEEPITKPSISQKEPITKPSISQKEPITKPPISQKKPITKPFTFKKNPSEKTFESNKPKQPIIDNQTQETIYNLVPFVPQTCSKDDPFIDQKTGLRKKPISWIYKRMKTGDEEDLRKLFALKPQDADINNLQEIVSKWKDSSFFSYIKDKSQINFNQSVWLPFKSETIEGLRNKLYTILKQENIKELKTHSTTIIPDSNVNRINTLSMNNNTCYLISILYMIQANKKLLEFISTHCNDKHYKKNLLDYLKKDQQHLMTKGEFNVLANFPHWKLKYGDQDDPNMFLLSLLKDKTNVSQLQFAFIGNLLITKTGAITNDAIYDAQETAHFSPSSFGLNFPVIELYITNPKVNYNIQDIFRGTKTNILASSQENLYLMPIFTTAPSFLCIKVVPGPYNTDDTEEFPEYMIKNLIGTVKKPVYKFHRHGNLVFQNEIYLRSLLHEECKYKLTGFLVYKLYKLPNILSGHYIPYFKIGNKWFCNYFNKRRDVTNEINFPLNMEEKERYIVSALFYERMA